MAKDKKGKHKKGRKDGIEAFEWGDPEPAMKSSDITNYLECWFSGKWYEPPISPTALAKSYRSAPHHSSAIQVKKNALVASFIPHKLFPRSEFKKLVPDYLIFGNGYVEEIRNRVRGKLKFQHSLAKYTRRGKEEGQFFFVNNYVNPHEFQRDSVHHLIEPDINQEIYGSPEYLSGLHSAWLNESATLFRRKYYDNGTHAGYIMYMTDPSHKEEDIDKLRQAMKDSKGPGNFRNLFMYAPKGKKDGIQVIPLSEVAAKDEFFNMKNVTRDDILAAHRVPPQLMGIVPQNTAGFGNSKEAAEVFNVNEIKPLQTRLSELNEMVGEEIIRFGDYELAVSEVAEK